MDTLKIEVERKLPGHPNLFQVFACVGFWNEEGGQVYESNRAGTMGSKRSQERAQRLSYQDFVLESLEHEIEALANSKHHACWPEGFKHGRSGSHLWVSDKDNNRVLFIHF